MLNTSGTQFYDILVIGAGGAGLMSSILAAERGYQVACLTKVNPLQSHTGAAQGGINASLGSVEHDDWRWHVHDTIKGSVDLADYDAVEYMCRKAPSIIHKLEEWGVSFSKQPNGKIDQRKYGGQTTDYGKGSFAYRACYVADKTGASIMEALYKKSLANKVSFFIEYFCLDLIIENNYCKGVICWNLNQGTIEVFRAHTVIIATGGYSQIYQENTSSTICTGDGNAMCARAGLALQDMEFVQFHPTSLIGSSILISEAARAEGGYLTNCNGEQFMKNYSPDLKDLACRDVVARSIATEIAEGRGVGKKKDAIYLNVSHLGKELIISKLPNLYENTKLFLGIDPTVLPIPIVPAAHYTMGGISTNINAEVIPGLMAVGEAACVSVHGANRLGCNSLLDILTFAYAAIDRCDELKIKNKNFSSIKEISYNLELEQKGDISPSKFKQSVKAIMQKNVGMFRDFYSLTSAIKELEELRNYRIKISEQGLIWNLELKEAIEAKNLYIQALLTSYSALNRKESRGSHYRKDYSIRDDKNYLKHTVSTIDKNYQVKIFYKNVQKNNF